ncbi:MAG: hypothetical protein RR085_09920 [Clostridia bacterium]
MKRLILGILSVLLAMVLAATAYAATVTEVFNDTFYEENHIRDDAFVSPSGFACTHDALYVLLSNHTVYSWGLTDGKYQKMCDLPPLPRYNAELSYDELSNDIKEQLQNVVFTFIPSDHHLLGFNPIHGRIGTIDNDGITWSDKKLDTTVLTRKGHSYPSSILYPFVNQNILYGFYDMSWEENDDPPCEGVLLAFDLESGACEKTDLQGAFTFCRYGLDSLLLMRDNGSEAPVLSKYSLQTKDIVDLPIPISAKLERNSFSDFYTLMQEIGGLAYDSVNDQIVYVYQCKVWSSIGGQPFEAIADLSSSISYLMPTAQGWFLSNGSYALQTNGQIYTLAVH